MINPVAKLSDKLFEADIPKAPTRDGFGKGVVEAARRDARVVVLCADLKESTRAEWFEKEFPTRFIEMGVAEQNMATVAAGMANVGKIPFIASYAAFSPGRNWEQIRTTIALNDMPVKVMGMHAGVSVGPDGATHQMLEDIALMRAMPNMIVLVPCDAEEARKAIIAAAQNGKPTYVRFGRSGSPVFTTSETPFQIGKALTLWESPNPKVAFIGSGAVVYEALLAAKALSNEGIGSIVINLASVKPIDEDAIVAAAKKALKVITIEEHQVAGGAGSAVAEVLARLCPTPMRFIGMQDSFGQSGEPTELLEHYGISAGKIAATARTFIAGS